LDIYELNLGDTSRQVRSPTEAFGASFHVL
jgi:hypothetical protein